jgi:anthranilate phosphoribosyltransferase
MKFVAEARKSLGIPTIFNVLGPLTNPGRARHQLLGVFASELTDRLAAVLRELGSSRAWVVHAEDGLDEISTLGPTRISELRNRHIHTWTLDPKDLGINDIALLNAAAAIVVAEKATDLAKGLELAKKSLDEGKAKAALDSLVTESQRE